MAVFLSPVFGVAGQVFDDNGNPLAGGKIYTYLAGTTTPAATYTSSSGSIAHTNPIVLDGAGRVPSGEIWLTDGIVYKFVVEDANNVLIGTYDNLTGINSNFVAFTNEQEIQTATAGQTVFNLTTVTYQPGTNSLSVFVDGVNQYGPGAQYAYVETDADTVTFVSGLHVGASVKFTTSQLNTSGAVDASQVTYTPPFVNSVITNVEDKLAQTISVKDFGAVGDGVTDDSAAINAAIAAMANPSTLVFPQATYKVDSEILIPYSGVNGSGKNLYFDNCTIIPGNNNMNIIHWCDSYGSTMGRVKLFANGRTGITCFRVTPELENANVTVTNQNYNRFMAYMQCSGADEGIVLMAGLPIGGTASGCWYNVFSGAQFGSIKRCIWFKDNGSVDIASSGSNSNTFNSMIMNGSINTGIQIDAGGGNMFYSPQFENITLGTVPNATPTALVIANAMANTGDNPNNMFYSPHWENCTRHSDIDEPITQMIFADMDFALSVGSATLETYIPVANNASQQFILAGIRSQATAEEVRLDNNGNVLLGGTNSLTASGNELILQNGKNVSGVNSTGATLYTMIKVNTSNQVELGSGSANLVVSSAQWAGASPALVTVGAADSGGVGFRVLRIPN